MFTTFTTKWKIGLKHCYCEYVTKIDPCDAILRHGCVLQKCINDNILTVDGQKAGQFNRSFSHGLLYKSITVTFK